MALFITRVMLHDAEGDDYIALHAAMERRSFHKQIRAENGQLYDSPWAEYMSHGNLQAEDVRAIAQAALAEVRKNGEILVSEVRRAAWSGLNLAR